MGKIRRHGLGGLLFALALCATGCNKNHDAEKLARLGNTVARKASALAAGTNQRWTKGVADLRMHWGRVAVDARVAARLSWDKSLEKVPIQVEADGPTIKLRGKVPDAATRRRAVELASSTAGVERVTDELEGE